VIALPVAIAALCYAWLYRRAVATAGGWPAWRAVSFALGLAALGAGALLSDRVLPAHMAGHALMVAIGAPLIVLGRPVTLALRASSPPIRHGLVRVLRSRPARVIAHPLVAWVAFVGVQLAFHLTPLFDIALHDGLVHEAEHAAFLATALLFWSVALASEPLPHALSAPARFVYLLAAMPVNDVAGAYLMSTGRPGAGAAMIAGMMPLGLAAVLVGWSWISGEERRVRVREGYVPAR
jgi:putative membrane protein